MMIIWILAALLTASLLWVILGYNALVRSRNRAQEAWADIDVQLKRRYDLIPNLIETVKGYVKHERETLEAVTRARAEAMQTHNKADATPDEIGHQEAALAGALKTVFALSEQYPQLKANTNFLQLQDELSDTENKTQAARRFYNGQVRDFNTAIQQFPASILASWFSFTPFTLFALEDSAQREPVKVSF